MISKELLDILACPKCKGDVRLNETKDGLVCDQCKLVYEIKDDIPIMLIEEAKKLNKNLIEHFDRSEADVHLCSKVYVSSPE